LLNPFGIVPDGTHVWVLSTGNYVTELSAATGSLTGILSTAS